MPSTTIANLQVDPALALDAKFRYDIPDRAYLDAQIRGTQQHVYDSGGLNGTQCAWYVVDGASASLVIGDVVCLAGTAGSFRNVTKAVAAALAAAGRALGVVMNPAGPGVNVRVAIAGTLPTSITGLAASANIAIRTSATARCENVATFGGTDYPVGYADAQGNLSLLLLSSPATSGGGSSLAGDVTGTTAASTVVGLTGTTNVVAMHGTTIQWDIGVNAPILKQADQTAGSTNGKDFTWQAQNATGATSTGGRAIMQGGTGTTAPGDLLFKSGANLLGTLTLKTSTKSLTTGATAACFQILANGSGQFIRFQANTTGSIYMDGDTTTFRSSAGTAKGLFDNTGLRIGDGSAPGVKLNVGTDADTTNVNIRVNGKTATTASTGANGAPPAQVDGYLSINVKGAEKKFPYYLV